MKPLKFNNHSLIPLFFAKFTIKILITVLFFDFLFFPFPVLAQAEKDDLLNISENNESLVMTEDDIAEEKILPENHLPNNPKKIAIKSGYHTITAYNSEVAQCDASPCITANGFNVCEHGIEDTVAANFLRFGTKIKIPELFGDRVFIVRDRMNKRYPERLDVWMLEKTDARKFGVRIAKIEILE